MLKYALNTTYRFWLLFLPLLSGAASAAMYGVYDFENIIQCLRQVIYAETVADDFLLIIMMNILPTFIFCVVTLNFFCSDVDTIYTYVLPRAGSIGKWYFYKVVSLFVQAAEFYAIHFCVILMHQFIKGNKFGLNEAGAIAAFILPYFLFGFCSALFINILSLIFNGKISFLIYLLGFSIFVLTLINLPHNRWLTAVNPVYNMLVTLHCPSALFGKYIGFPKFDGACFKNVFSYIYFTAAALILYFSGAIIISSKSLLLRKEKQS